MVPRSRLRFGSLSAHVALVGLLLAATQMSLAQSGWRGSSASGNGSYIDAGSGNHGMPFGDIAIARAEKSKDVFFHGSTARIFVPDAPSLAIVGTMTISAWIKVNSFPQCPHSNGQIRDPYFQKIIDGGSLEFDGNLGFQWRDTDVGQMVTLISPSIPIPVGRFVFVAAVLDAKYEVEGVAPMKVYVDGTLKAEGNSRISSSESVVVSSFFPYVSEWFDPIVYDVKIRTMADPQVTPVEFHLSQSSVKGGSKVNATLTLDDSPITAVSASVSSAVAAVCVPPTVTVAAGRYSADFVIETQHVTIPQAGTITVTLNGVTLSTPLTVTP